MSRRGVQPDALLDFQRLQPEQLGENARRAAITRAARSAQLPLQLGERSAAREATIAELRELLERLPKHADLLQYRRALRAIRTALGKGWVAWTGSTLHRTKDGEAALERLGL